MPLLLAQVSVGTPVMWAGFLGLVVLLLALDLGVFHRKAHAVTLKEAAVWSAVWVSLSGVFALLVWHWFGPRTALEFTTGYLIEKALSVDNIFVFVVIFAYFAVPKENEHRVLFWGILGALILRGVFVLLGGAFLARFHWAIFVFGGLLVLTGVKLLIQRDAKPHPERNPILRLFRRLVPMWPDYEGARFFVRSDGRWFATPLLAALVTVEATDVVFAVDSIPAIFAITADPFIVFTSNIFAILGLRSLYFLLAGIVDKFHYLKLGLALVLVFVGGKMLLSDVWKVPIGLSLGVVAFLLTASVVASLVFPKREPAAPPEGAPVG